ncbi:hypothetical protein, partial [Leisingera sp.]|uniref:hypothetical protein n=1 Tax=Leisingera sp. TaxID=1879318 RepID=UPI002B27B476
MKTVTKRTRAAGLWIALLTGVNYLFHAFGFVLIDWNSLFAAPSGCAAVRPGLAGCQIGQQQAAALFELILGMAVLLFLSVALVVFLLLRDAYWLVRFGKDRKALSGMAVAALTLFPAAIGHTLWSYLTAGAAAFAGTRVAGL